MNIDWSKAPEGATHKDPDTDCFYKIVKGVWHLIYEDGEKCVSSSLYNGETKPSDLIERPKKQEAWDGEGLPPVNCFCETLDEDADCWVKVEIYAHTEFMGETHACAKNGADMFCGLAHEFRPIKTAEQMEEEDKKKTIDDMQRIYEESMLDYSSRLGHASRPAIKALYEAGYRKQ